MRYGEGTIATEQMRSEMKSMMLRRPGHHSISQVVRPTILTRSGTVRVRAEEEGVAGLLARDRKGVKVAPELGGESFVPTFEDKKEEAKAEAKRKQTQEVLKSRKQRQEDMANAKAADPNRWDIAMRACDPPMHHHHRLRTHINL